MVTVTVIHQTPATPWGHAGVSRALLLGKRALCEGRGKVRARTEAQVCHLGEPVQASRLHQPTLGTCPSAPHPPSPQLASASFPRAQAVQTQRMPLNTSGQHAVNTQRRRESRHRTRPNRPPGPETRPTAPEASAGAERPRARAVPDPSEPWSLRLRAWS